MTTKSKDTDDILELSEKEKAFVDFYLQNGRNATEAYREISDCTNIKSCGTLGQRMFKKVEKSVYYVEKNREILQNYGLSQKIQIERLNEIVHRSMQGKAKLEYDKEEKRLVEKLDENGNIVYEYDARAVIEAIKEQNKILGFHKPVKTENKNETEIGLTEDIKYFLDALKK